MAQRNLKVPGFTKVRGVRSGHRSLPQPLLQTFSGIVVSPMTLQHPNDRRCPVLLLVAVQNGTNLDVVPRSTPSCLVSFVIEMLGDGPQ